MLSGSCVRSGLRLLHNGKGRPFASNVSSRSLSSRQVRSQPILQHSNALSYSLAVKQLSRSSLLCESRRFASTTPVPPPLVNPAQSQAPPLPSPSPPPSPSPVVENATASDWNSVFDDITSAQAGSLEPHIGYLKEMGIDFGWGTSSIVQWAVEHLHVYGGLPWIGAIVGTVVIARIALLRLYVNAADSAARMSILTPHMKPLQEKLKVARDNGDNAGMAKVTQELKQMYVQANVKPLAMFFPAVLQIPLGFGIWRLTRSMAELPVPGLDESGILWFTDLTVPDPLYLLPLGSSLIMYFAFKRGGEMGTNSAAISPAMQTIMLYILPALSFFVTVTFPAATQVSFTTTSVWTYLQTTLFQSAAVRRWLQIQPLPAKPGLASNRKSATAAAANGPYKGTISRYEPPGSAAGRGGMRSQWNAMKDRATAWMKSKERKPTTRLSASTLARAKRYETERRAEIDAAKERLEAARRLRMQQRGGGGGR